MAIAPGVKARVRQQALRQMCFGPDGGLTKNARLMAAYLRRFCLAYEHDRGSPTFIVSPHTGAIDPLAMARAAGRREVFDHLARMLSLTLEDRHNLKDEL